MIGCSGGKFVWRVLLSWEQKKEGLSEVRGKEVVELGNLVNLVVAGQPVELGNLVNLVVKLGNPMILAESKMQRQELD
jgi:hypothetical protein